MLHPLKTIQGQKREPLNYVSFLLITHVDSTLFLIHFRKFHMLNFHLQSIPCIQTYSFGVFSGIVWFRNMLGHWWVVNENYMWQQNFKQMSNIWSESKLFYWSQKKRQRIHKISKESRIAITSVVEVDNYLPLLR